VPNTSQTSNFTTGVYYHIWHAGDPTSGLVFQSSVSANLSYICTAYHGVNQTSPFGGAASIHNLASLNATSPSVNGSANDMLLMLYGMLGSHSFTNNSEGTVEAALGNGPSEAWVDAALTGTGPTGSQTVTVSGTNSNASNGVQITLIPG
jgi:hypothetical protein